MTHLKELTYKEKMQYLVADFGLENLIPMLPTQSKEDLLKAYNEDPAFNTIPLKKWDACGGFMGNACGKVSKRYHPFHLFLEKHQYPSTPSTHVGILKEAARQYIGKP